MQCNLVANQFDNIRNTRREEKKNRNQEMELTAKKAERTPVTQGETPNFYMPLSNEVDQQNHTFTLNCAQSRWHLLFININ